MPQFLIGDMNTKPGTDQFRILRKTTEMQDFPIDDERPYTCDSNNSWNPGKKDPSKPGHVLLNPRGPARKPCARGTGTTIMRQTIQRARKEHEGKTIDLSDHYGVVAEILLKR